MTKSTPSPAPVAIDVVDGIPDRSQAPDRWRVVKVFAVYLAWIGVLVYMLLGGLPHQG
jgi:hypothetical protein